MGGRWFLGDQLSTSFQALLVRKIGSTRDKLDVKQSCLVTTKGK